MSCLDILKMTVFGILGYILIPCFIGWTMGAYKSEFTYSLGYNVLAFIFFALFLCIGFIAKFYLGGK